MEFSSESLLRLLNFICFNEIGMKENFKELTSVEQFISQSGIDSFDFVMLYLFVGEAYGINDGLFREHLPETDITLATLFAFVDEHKTKIVDFDKFVEKYKR